MQETMFRAFVSALAVGTLLSGAAAQDGSCDNIGTALLEMDSTQGLACTATVVRSPSCLA